MNLTAICEKSIFKQSWKFPAVIQIEFKIYVFLGKPVQIALWKK